MKRMTQLEERLFADHDGRYRAQLISQLEAVEKRLQACLRQPCTSAQYDLYSQQCTAVENAKIVIETIWRVYHQGMENSNQISAEHGTANKSQGLV